LKYPEIEHPTTRQAVFALVIRGKGPQVMLVANRVGHRVDHADGIVVAIRDDEPLAIRGDGQPACVGLNVPANASVTRVIRIIGRNGNKNRVLERDLGYTDGSK
jgi:hypothetical protein